MTRKVLRILGSRYGIAAILLVLVIVVVGLARANGGSGPGTSVNGSDSVETQDEGKPDDGVASPSQKSTLPKAAVGAATKFTDEYIDTDRSAKKWRAAVGKHGTKKVKDELKLIDPDVVPVTEIRDEPSMEGQSVQFPTDAGLLILLMQEQDGKWLVNGIDNDNT